MEKPLQTANGFLLRYFSWLSLSQAIVSLAKNLGSQVKQWGPLAFPIIALIELIRGAHYFWKLYKLYHNGNRNEFLDEINRAKRLNVIYHAVQPILVAIGIGIIVANFYFAIPASVAIAGFPVLLSGSGLEVIRYWLKTINYYRKGAGARDKFYSNLQKAINSTMLTIAFTFFGYASLFAINILPISFALILLATTLTGSFFEFIKIKRNINKDHASNFNNRLALAIIHQINFVVAIAGFALFFFATASTMSTIGFIFLGVSALLATIAPAITNCINNYPSTNNDAGKDELAANSENFGYDRTIPHPPCGVNELAAIREYQESGRGAAISEIEVTADTHRSSNDPRRPSALPPSAASATPQSLSSLSGFIDDGDADLTTHDRHSRVFSVLHDFRRRTSSTFPFRSSASMRRMTTTSTPRTSAEEPSISKEPATSRTSITA